MKIIIINASHRTGNTDLIVQVVSQALEKYQHQVKVIKLREIEMQLPDGCIACAGGEICPNIHDEFSKLVEPTLHDFDCLILATPTWSDNVTPLLNIFMNRIVSWCHEERMYLKNKKLAVITHGMADQRSWDNVINWVKSVSRFEGSFFAGALACQTPGSILRNINEIDLSKKQIAEFISHLF